ncbi:glycine cleavage system aminomethyltransferase GcvT [Chengkuizengella sediminis]|uniref:glycine cleavage system aminomethyltransferase GcvT n=1 Tax=Chengkuizengella sediminis TaxID=1885917 RepID=UPI001389592C|nr:glycine cleavage system aminomethyltransferase GcvT [Chengkuizengella sediminis]NDI36264.1 glycine cleavage system aminomethyltransferase GcvT [Chengkuizengella sediminis]
MSELKRTPLFNLYEKYPSARCIDFGGWELPVQFFGIQKEHEAVRNQAGLFDVSHMGEFIVTGKDAEHFIQHMTTNDITKLNLNQAQYTLMCYPDGGVVDDLLVYKISENEFMLVVNASNIDKDLEWLQKHITGDVIIENKSDQTALLALQGPNAEKILSRVTDNDIRSLSPFHFIHQATVCGVEVLLSRTGYTGEDGFEIYCSSEDAPIVWEGLLNTSEPEELTPVGLGARDTLRFEARLPLYGQELSKDITPLEASVGFFVKLDKGDFIGRDALAEQKQQGLTRKLVGIEMIDRGIPRYGYSVFVGDDNIGKVTTGTQSPTLKRNLGLAILDIDYTKLDTEIWVEIRGKKLKAKVIKAPFYKRPKVTKEGE